MKNTEILEQRGELGNVRQYMGAKDDNDTSRDERINAMGPANLASAYAGWHFGGEGWAHHIIRLYEAVKKNGDVKED